MKIPVIGVYQTKFGELWHQSLTDLILEAGRGALTDAGLAIRDIETIFVGNMLAGLTQGQEHLTSVVASVLGSSVPVVRVEAACASGGMAVHQAVLAILSGEAETALVVGAEKMTDQPAEEIAQALMAAASPEEQEAGLTFPGLYALLAQEYLRAFGATERDLAQVAVKNHHHASLNPRSHFPFPVTLNQVLASSPIADPLKLLDCSPVSDGAAAVVLASSAWVKRRAQKNGISIVGSGQASDVLGLSERRSLVELAATRQAAHKALSAAGAEAKDVSVAEVHDCFTIAEILALEDLGFYKKGEGYVVEGNGEVRLGGKRPINTSGGLKACGHPVGATGVKQIVETVWQLREAAGKRQVPHPRLALTHNVGGSGGTCVVHLLAR
jgi:acetyl-CoA C-acetyltransferase